MRDYLLAIVRATREHPDVTLGASTRAALALYKASQARAAMLGRTYVIPDDVKRLAGPTLAHRLIVRPEATLRGRSSGVDPRRRAAEHGAGDRRRRPLPPAPESRPGSPVDDRFLAAQVRGAAHLRVRT